MSESSGRTKGSRSYFRKRFEQELIVSKLQPPGPHAFVLILDHLKAGYNSGKIVRTANAFGCREVHLVGVPFFDIRAARGTLKQTRTRSFENFKDSYEALAAEGYTFYALDLKA